MATADVAPPAEAGPSFEALLADIQENPERVMDDDLTPEQVLELQKRLNPYAYVAGDAGSTEHQRSAAASYTNLRADYMKRFIMTSLVGFVFRLHDEWEVPAEQRRWTSKAAAKRAEEEAAARRAAKVLTPDDLLERAEALRELAQLAKDAEAEAEAAKAKAVEADGGEGAGEGAGKDVASAALEAETTAALYKQADEALAKSRGLLYSATYEFRKLGQEADSHLDAIEAVARQHLEVAQVIDRNPVHRPVAGQMEMPPSEAKKIITSFLRNWFEYNPDAHVRSAHDEFVIEKATGEVDVPGLGKVRGDEADPERLPLEVVRHAAPKISSPEDKAAFDALTVTSDAYNAAVYMLRNEQAAKALTAALAAPEKFRRYLLPIAPDSAARAAIDVIPPQDTFHRWNYYQEVNYEALRTATEAIYHEKPDLDWALILYEFFEGTPDEVSKAFEKFRDQHQDEVISDIKGIEFGGWTLLGDFKENRDKVTFYNKHTDVLKRILDRHAEDKKLGADLMRNRVRQVKAKNIQEQGPDAPGLSEYKTQNGGKGLDAMGAERPIKREEMLRLERARGVIRAAKELEILDQARLIIRDLSDAAKVRELTPEEDRRLKDAQADLVRAEEMVEVPEDAIQVDVFTHDTASGDFAKSKFYTKAEAPEHISQIQDEQAAVAGVAPGAGSRQDNLPAGAQKTTISDLAPFAQHQLAREVAASQLERAGASAAPDGKSDGKSDGKKEQ